jgi:opacity protein-like surface antigen
LSGITGTNSSSQKKGVGMMKRPAITKAPTRTSVKQTSTETTYGIPLSFGAGVKFDFTPRWSLGVGLNYTLLTSKFYGNYTKVGEDGAIEASHQSNIRNSQHYLGIPVNAYYNIINQERLNFYAYAGGTVEKCIADRYQVLSTSIVHNEKAKGVQLSANIGIGVEFMLGNHLGLYIDPSLRYYFNCRQPKSIRTAQPLMLGFEMGLRVKI